MKTRVFYISILSQLLMASGALGVTWNQQAERLQLVSASLLDATPVLSPGSEGYVMTAKSVVSTLPKMNATVGGKTEQPPQPPVHAVPTAELMARRHVANVMSLSGRAWGGYLPGAAAAATGMTASCAQSIYGGAVGAWSDLNGIGSFGIELGQQRNQAQIKGGITEVQAKDKFDVRTTLNFFAVTLTPVVEPSLWVQGQRIARQVATTFEIPNDGTKFELTDRSSLGSAAAATQVALGYDFKNHISAAVAYIHVPERVSMPRFLVGYNMPIGRIGGTL